MTETSQLDIVIGGLTANPREYYCLPLGMQMLGKQMGKKKSFISLYSQNPDQKSEKTAAVDRETENVLEEMRLEKKGTIDGCKQLASVIYDSAHECH